MIANELRIGNYYQWYADGKYYYFQIKPEDFQKRELTNFEPIPLTEEILLKCGFSTSQWDNHSTFRYLFCSNGSMVISLEHKYIEIGDLTLDIEAKHLHQLQNLYFALTNEELNIEL